MVINKEKVKRAVGFIVNHASKMERYPDESADDGLVRCLIQSCLIYRPDSWRNNRNALAYAFEAQDNNELAHRLHNLSNPLTMADAPDAFKKLIPKKQPRATFVIDDDLLDLMQFLKKRKDLAVLGAVVIAKIIGVRPSEMISMAFNDKVMTIDILGAKKRDTDDRGLDRMLRLSKVEYDLVREAHNNLLGEKTLPDCKPERAMKRVQNRLYKIVRQLWKGRKSYPSLYSLRHQLGSDLKASELDRVTMAAIMGHRSMESINTYGNRRHAGRKVDIEVSAATLNLVKVTKITVPPSQRKKQNPSKVLAISSSRYTPLS